VPDIAAIRERAPEAARASPPLRSAAERALAKFGFPIARTLGQQLSMRNHARLAALIGVARTKDLLFLPAWMDAQEMRPSTVTRLTTEQGFTRARPRWWQ